MVVIALSFAIATITERLPFFRIEHRVDFDALRIACSFPNVVAIPVLVFPSLCEYEVVWKVFLPTGGAEEEELTRNPITECSNTLNAMTFSYFFAWLFMFFLLGNQSLISAGKRKAQEEEARSVVDNDVDIQRTVRSNEPPVDDPRFENDASVNDESDDPPDFSNEQVNIPAADDNAKRVWEDTAEDTKNAARTFLIAVKRSIINPGSIALWAGLITALIGPLQAALFAPGGALRFVGSAIESLAAALPSVATMITAASLIVPPNPIPVSDDGDDSSDNGDKKKRRWASFWPLFWLKHDDDVNAVYDPNFAEINVAEEKPQQRRQRPSLARMRQESVRLGSQVKRQALLALRRPTWKMHAWFNVTRLVITPAIVCGILIGLDCGTSLFDTIPHLAKLVIIVNSSVPPAMLVILSLKSEGMSESATVVSKLFTSSYLLSVISIAGWAAMGLMLSLPDDDGRYFCQRI
jgi:cbb3-type cytochrome oxidase subunit 3